MWGFWVIGTSSMVAAICYAWLLENRARKSKGEGDEDGCIFVLVMNVRRERMWKQWQAAWLFHHSGLDATSLLFADEVLSIWMIVLIWNQINDQRKTEGVGFTCSFFTQGACFTLFLYYGCSPLWNDKVNVLTNSIGEMTFHHD